MSQKQQNERASFSDSPACHARYLRPVSLVPSSPTPTLTTLDISHFWLFRSYRLACRCLRWKVVAVSSDANRFSFSRDGHLLDSFPLTEGKGIFVFENDKWVPWKGTVGEWSDSIHITAEEAALYCKDGVLPEPVKKAIAGDTGYYPEPFDD